MWKLILCAVVASVAGVAIWELTNARGLVLGNTLLRDPAFRADITVMELKGLLAPGVLVQLQHATAPAAPA